MGGTLCLRGSACKAASGDGSVDGAKLPTCPTGEVWADGQTDTMHGQAAPLVWIRLLLSAQLPTSPGNVSMETTEMERGKWGRGGDRKRGRRWWPV